MHFILCNFTLLKTAQLHKPVVRALMGTFLKTQTNNPKPEQVLTEKHVKEREKNALRNRRLTSGEL